MNEVTCQDGLASEDKQKNRGKKVKRALFPILDRKFQVKTTLFLLLIFLVSYLFLFAIHYRNLRQTTVGSTGKAGSQMVEYLQKQNRFATRDLLLGVVVISAAIGLVVFYMTQIVSGPLFSISRVLDKVSKGDLSARVALRKSDELHWFGDQFNKTLQSLEEQERERNQILKELGEQLQEGKPVSAMAHKIKELTEKSS